MSISFHCNHCGKKIEAADTAGGKWGKCPACHNKVYVPDLAAPDDEELKLAPLDAKEEENKRRLMAETFRLEQSILNERETPEGKDNNKGVSKPKPAEINEKELTNQIISYLRLMADGDIATAGQIAKALKNQGFGAIKILDRISLSDIPEPELSDIPAQVLSGLIRNLRGQINK